MTTSRIAAERLPTLYFLREIRSFSPVFLDTEVDMEAVTTHRCSVRKYSIVSYVLHAAARVLSAHPEANAAIRGRIRPRVARFDRVDGKFTLDRRLRAQRVVLSTVLRDVNRLSLAQIQEQVDRFRDGDPESMPEFGSTRLLHRMPPLIGAAMFRYGVRPLRRRANAMGTFAVTSLGHRAVDGFFSVGGTTITIGVGRIVERPVARRGIPTVAPVMRLSLTFDHRVIDGAEAADVLTEIKDALESFAE